jgi:hypothetical protein
VSPLEQALADAQSIEAEFGCEARPCVRRDDPPGVEAILHDGRVRLSGDASEVRAELLERAAAKAARRRRWNWRRPMLLAARPMAGKPGPKTRGAAR